MPLNINQERSTTSIPTAEEMNKKQKVLHVMRSLDAGGIGTFILNVYHAVDRDSVQFDFAITSKGMGIYGPQIEAMGGRIFFISDNGNRGLFDGIKQMWNLYKLCRDGNYEVVHVHYYFANAFFLLCALLAGIKKRVSHCHTAQTKKPGLKRKIFNAVSRQLLFLTGTDFLGCADAATIYLYGEKAFRSGKAKTLYNGIDYAAWDISNYDIKALRQRYALTDERVIIFVGRLEKPKNPIYALKVMKEVHRQNSNTIMFFVGTGSYEQDVTRFIAENNMSEYVRCMPQNSNIKELQAVSDVMLAPSLREGLSIAFIEAQKMDTLVVTSDQVSQEIDMGRCEFISLESKSKWVDSILDKITERKQYELTKHVEDFNVKTTAKKLMTIYFGADDAQRIVR